MSDGITIANGNIAPIGNTYNNANTLTEEITHSNGQGEASASKMGNLGEIVYNVGRWANSGDIAEAKGNIDTTAINSANTAQEQQEMLAANKKRLETQQDAGDAFENRQIHRKEKDLADIIYKGGLKEGWKNANGRPYTVQEIQDALRWANSTKYKEKFNDIISGRTNEEDKLFDNVAGDEYEERLWAVSPGNDGHATMTQDLSRIKKPDENLIRLIKSYSKSYGYSWDKGTYTKYTPPKQVATTPSKPKLPTKSTNPAKKYTYRDLSNQRAATLNNNGSVLPGKLPEQQQRDNAATAKKVGTVVEVGTVVTTGGAGLTVGLGRTGLKQATKQVIKKTAKNAGKGAASGAVIGGASYYAVTPAEDRSLEKGIKYATGGAVTGALSNTLKKPSNVAVVGAGGTMATQYIAGDKVDIPSAVVNGTTGGILKPSNLGFKGDVIQGVATTVTGEIVKIKPWNGNNTTLNTTNNLNLSQQNSNANKSTTEPYQGPQMPVEPKGPQMPVGPMLNESYKNK